MSKSKTKNIDSLTEIELYQFLSYLRKNKMLYTSLPNQAIVKEYKRNILIKIQ